MRLPVIVFIHGESFEWNSGNPYDGSLLASHGGLVVVTINFRLGVLGFLNANSDAGPFRSPANYGLMDQIAALHWIQENIAAFGGDPGSVTILGHGTGAACANFLMVSPAIPDGMLFHRVILMSGSALSPWSLVKDPWRHALAVARHVNCTWLLPPSPRLLRCLREKPLSDLTSAPIPTTPFAATAFGPSVDGVVVDADAAGGLLPPPRSTSFGGGGSGGFSSSGSSATSSVGQGSSGIGSGPGSLDSGTGSGFDSDANGASAAAEAERRRRRKKYVDRLARYDLLFGVVRAEAYFAFTAEDLQYGIETDRRSRLLRTFVRNTYRYHLSEILATVVNEYTDWERPVQHPVNIRDETLEALSDATVVAPLVQTGDYHASAAAALTPPQAPPGIDPAPAPAPASPGSATKAKSTYFYVFEYQTKFGDYPQRQGCVHGEELPYVFGAPLAPQTATPFPKNFTKSEAQLSEATIIYWSNFARTGNPNEPQEADVARGVRQERNRFRNIDWAPYEGMHKKYLNLDTKPRLKNHYRAHRLSFWLNLVPDLHRPGGDGVPATHHLLPSDVATYDGQSPIAPPPPPRLGPPGTHTPFNLTALLVPPRGQWDEDGPDGQIGESEAEAVASAAASGHGPVANRTHSSSSSSGTSPVEAAAAAGSDTDDGFAAYSTALSVTIAIGCSLLILNVLIFAGVYYQRDKHRLEAKKRSENGRMPNISGEVGDSASSSGGLPSAKASPQTAGGNGRTQLPPPEFADLPHHHHHHHHHHPAMGGAGLVAVPVPVPPPPKVSSASPGSQSQLPPKAGTAGDETGVTKLPRSECQPLLPQGIQLLPQTFRTSPIVQSGTATVKKAHQRQAGKAVTNAEELRV
ncbi:neuroligin-4, X-linked [Hetaerina americana]|uniref:neuroligin-4, X-linked n=1 Tax=Hetaerina americana TaxID=62018 RepID=UPI003A7F2FD3